ncbi:MAG: hypothetical protein JO314_00135 [Acidobacteria bacterium]|nr:hypothetical protein [Acidobacteriota bacterium]
MPYVDPKKKEALHREVELRYTTDAKKRKKRNRVPFTVSRARIADLKKIFRDRYGNQFPNDDAGRDDIRVMAHHFAWHTNHPHLFINYSELMCGSWLPPAELAQIIAEVKAKPRFWSADELAEQLNLNYADRMRLGIKSIGAGTATRSSGIGYRKKSIASETKNTRKRNGASEDVNLAICMRLSHCPEPSLGRRKGSAAERGSAAEPNRANSPAP